MGFGFLLLGYLMFFNIQAQSISIDPFCDLVGYILMLIGLCKLCKYNRGFRYAKYVDIVLLPIGVLTLLLQVQSTFAARGISSVLDVLTGVASVYRVLLSFLVLLFHAALYWGIYEMATEVALPKLRKASLRNLILTVLYYVFILLLHLFREPLGTLGTYFNGPMQLYGYLWILLGAVCIFNCYRLICLPGDEDMPPRNNLFYRVMNRKKKADPSALSPEEALQYAKEQREQDKRAYNAQMQRRQQERTRKKKRGKHRK